MSAVKELRLTHRQRQAMQTRQLIVEAARSLFVSRGYAETSLEAVAETAGVAPRTVYSVFGSKKSLLGAICEAWLAEAGIPEAIAEGLREPDLRRRLLIVARASRRQWELERGTSALLQGAAASDADVSRMLAGWKEDRANAWRLVVDGSESQLRPDVDPSHAVALLRALTTWEVYLELVPGAGWTPSDYETWLGGLLTDLLLPPP
jgi:TetR/AcrR family transcriptional regulator, regulator of autoinduction and epiphytic fitness